MGLHPTAARSLNEIFIPSAAIAVTKDTPNNNCYEFAECRGLIV